MFCDYNIGVILMLAMVHPLKSKPFSIGTIPETNEDISLSNTIRRPRQNFFFPESDDDEEPTIHLPKIEGPPPCAAGTTFCENFEPYPKKLLKDILKKNRVNKEFFGVDEVPEDVGTRDGNNVRFVCASTKATIFPKIGKNKSNTWKFIVNEKDEGYVQGVQTELCRREGKPCDVVVHPNGFLTSCEQKYIFRRLLSFTEEGVIVQDTFQLPSACACSYRRDFNSLRVGFSPQRV